MLKNKEKQRIRIYDVPYLYLDQDIFKGDIEEVSKNILNIRNFLKKEYEERRELIENKTFTPFEDYQYIILSFTTHNGFEISIDVYRDETDKEEKERLQKDKEYNIQLKQKQLEIKAKQEEDEKALFEKLKQKYG